MSKHLRKTFEELTLFESEDLTAAARDLVAQRAADWAILDKINPQLRQLTELFVASSVPTFLHEPSGVCWDAEAGRLLVGLRGTPLQGAKAPVRLAFAEHVVAFVRYAAGRP